MAKILEVENIFDNFTESQFGLVSFCLHNLCGLDRVGGSAVVLNISENVALCHPVAVEMFALRTDFLGDLSVDDVFRMAIVQ